MEKNTAHLLQEIQKAFYNPDFGQENWEVLRKKVDTALATSQPESPTIPKGDTVLSPRRILESIYECEPSDLQFSITLNPAVERIVRAMESYAQQFQSPAPLSAEEIERLSEDYAESVISEDTTATYTAAQAYHHVKKAYKMALLSQRQPVAPEREEKDMDKAWMWWGSLSVEERDRVWSGYKHNSYDEKILAIWRKETSPSAENKGGEG